MDRAEPTEATDDRVRDRASGDDMVSRSGETAAAHAELTAVMVGSCWHKSGRWTRRVEKGEMQIDVVPSMPAGRSTNRHLETKPPLRPRHSRTGQKCGVADVVCCRTAPNSA